MTSLAPAFLDNSQRNQTGLALDSSQRNQSAAAVAAAAASFVYMPPAAAPAPGPAPAPALSPHVSPAPPHYGVAPGPTPAPQHSLVGTNVMAHYGSSMATPDGSISPLSMYTTAAAPTPAPIARPMQGQAGHGHNAAKRPIMQPPSQSLDRSANARAMVNSNAAMLAAVPGPQPANDPNALSSSKRFSMMDFDPLLAGHSSCGNINSANKSALPDIMVRSPARHVSLPVGRQTAPNRSGTAASPKPLDRRSASVVPAGVTTTPHHPHMTAVRAPGKRGSLTPPATKRPEVAEQQKKQQKKKQHRRDVQSFCVSDLRSISQDALDDVNNNSDPSLNSGNLVVKDNDKTKPTTKATTTAPKAKTAVPATTSKSPSTSRSGSPKLREGAAPDSSKRKPTSPGKAKKIGTAMKEILNTSGHKKDTSASPKKNTVLGGGSTGVATAKSKAALPAAVPPPKVDQTMTPQRNRMRPWAKKGHRRTRSLESKEAALALPPSGQQQQQQTGTSEKRSSMYPSIVQDLMDLKLGSLQMPSLAKPSPTSFLTGKEDEVVRAGHEPTPYQVEIPTLSEFVVMARLCEFVENYRRVDQNFDLGQWVGKSRMDLRQVKIPQHIPIAQSILDCGESVSLQGSVYKGSKSADERLEAVVFEGQRQFTCVFRGTTEQQSKIGNKQMKKKAVPLDKGHETVEVYQCFLEEYVKLEADCFALLDKLTEENPFCDVVFTGHSFGAAMATLAAYRYANSRPMMRASCLTLGSPKVGFSLFRHMVNGLPNLKVFRVEYGQDGKTQLPSVGGSHVGHTLVVNEKLGSTNTLKPASNNPSGGGGGGGASSSSSSRAPVLAYKFDGPKLKKFKTTHPDLRSYVNALEEFARLNLPWATEFVGTSGQGVIVNNETRQVV